MDIDRNGLEILDRDECFRLLGMASIGRVGLGSGRAPLILPVSYRVVAGRIVFRTGRGSKLDAAARNVAVSFEVDEIDVARHAGWSVLAVGTASDASDGDLPPHDRAALARWAPAAENCVVAITVAQVTGRRLIRHASRP